MGIENYKENFANAPLFKKGDPYTIECARKAGIAAGVARRRSSSLRKALKQILQGDYCANDADIVDLLQKAGIEDPTNAEGLAMAAVLRATNGNVEAMKFVRDTIGEVPTNKVELTGDPDRPIATMDLSGLSDAELLDLIERAQEEEADDGDAETQGP